MMIPVVSRHAAAGTRVAASFSTAASAGAPSASVLSKALTEGLPLLWRVSENPYARTGQWIMGTAGMVVGMIHVGGLTRLTQSGLSMTTWSPLGSLPPLSAGEWEAEFRRYQAFPEWQQRQSMTLREFQYIYAWEYGHRMLGRAVGVVFCLPWLYFSIRGKIPAGFQGRMVGLCAMGGTQGLVGWWMVKSGLGDDRRQDKHEIRVKPARLTSHLSMAMATYAALLWTGFDILSLPHQPRLAQLSQQLSDTARTSLRRLRNGSLVLSGLTFVTIASGALVAGNDAGRAFNTWPKMDGDWIPASLYELLPWERNFLEHTATVQFHHRVLATTTAAVATSLVVLGWPLVTASSTAAATAAATTTTTTAAAACLTPQVQTGLVAVGIATAGQFTLGVTALLNYVPLSLAAAHQLGSVVVLTSSLYLAHALRYVAVPARRVAAAAAPMTTTTTSAAARGAARGATSVAPAATTTTRRR